MVYYEYSQASTQLGISRSAANHTFDVAGSLFGEGSLEQNAIFNAWREAGIDAEKPDLVANVRPRIIMR